MSALLQFEDFAAPRIAAAQVFSADDVARHYQLGLTEGAALAQDAAIDQLSGLLETALAAAGAEADIRRRAVIDTLAAVVPVLHALTLQLASLPCDRLIDHLSAELQKLCLAGIAPTCRISGHVELIERLGDRITELGLSGVTLLPGPRTEIIFEGGRITVEPDELTAQIGAILAEILASMED